MGVLIYLPERAQASLGASEPAQGPAQILFFTGVRYVRDDVSAAETGDGRGNAAQRTRSASDTPRDRRRRG